MTPQELISHHVALLKDYRPRDLSFVDSCQSFAEAHAKLVPESGQALSMQGEVARAVNRLAGEDRRNGCMNWDNGYELFVDFLRSTFLDATIFNTSQIARNSEALNLVNLNGTEEQASDQVDEAFAVLIESSVIYCEHHKELIQRVADPNLSL